MATRSVSVSDIRKALDLPVESVLGSPRRRVSGVAPLLEARSASVLTFCAGEKTDPAALIARSKAGVVICARDVNPRAVDLDVKTLVVADDPRRAFMHVMDRYFQPPRPAGIHKTAVIEKSVTIGKRVYVGPHTYIGPNVTLGDDTCVFGNVHIYGPATIGKRCTIHAGAVLGADGFGFWRTASGALQKFPHVGGIVIHDDVEIGANTAVDRGTLGNTVIGARSKVDNLVHVAHNVQIGEDCGIVALTLLGGSVTIGDRSWVAPAACVRDRLDIGRDALVGMGAVVTRSVADGEVVFGVPAKPKAVEAEARVKA